MTGPLLPLDDAEKVRCRSAWIDQVEVGIANPVVSVVTSWGWVTGDYDEEHDAVRVRRVTVRAPRLTAVEWLASGPDQIVHDSHFPRGVNLRRLRHYSAWLFLFGGLTGFLSPLIGLGWVFAASVTIIAAAELALARARRRALASPDPNSAPGRNVVALSTSHAHHEAMWAAATNPQLHADQTRLPPA